MNTKATVNEARTANLFLIRGLIAIAWAGLFAVAADSLTTGVTAVAGILLVLYPTLDLVASVIDARDQRGSARRLLLINAAVSAVTAVAIGVAATGSVKDVFYVFGLWAGLNAAAQLVVALRRRGQLGNQWPLLLANGVSVIGGVAFVTAAAVGDPSLSMLSIYAATGGVEFVIQAGRLARRRRRMIAVPADGTLAPQS